MGYGVLTRYAGPTNYRGSRIIAAGPSLRIGGRQVRRAVPWDYALDAHENHRAGAEAVCAILRADGWRVTVGREIALPDESGYVFALDYGEGTR